MTQLSLFFTLLLVLLQFCQAEDLARNLHCVTAVSSVYNNILFNDVKVVGGRGATCPSKLQALSIYGAATKYCSRDDLTAGVQMLYDTCMELGKVLTPLTVFTSNLSSSVDTWPILSRKEYSTANFSKPALITKSWFDVSLRTVKTTDYEMRIQKDYGWAAYGYWGTILLAGIVINISRSFMPRSTSKIDAEGARARIRSLTKFVRWIETYITMTPIFGNHHRRLLLGCHVPTRLEAVVIYGYWIVSLVSCCVNYRTFNGNTRAPTATLQGLVYISDRCGSAAYANLALVWLFAGRNNVFLWATGWSFTTFNLFHKHVARIATIEAIVHASVYTAYFRINGNYTRMWSQAWFVLGAVAVTSMSLLVGTASVLLRKRSYEIFLVLHIAFAILVIYCLFSHTARFNGYYEPYLWPVVAIWSFDRLLRVARLITCNVGVSKSGILFTKSEVFYDAASDILKIVITPPRACLLQIAKPGPGEYFYLYRPLSWKGWENHPFSLGSYWGTPGSPSVSNVSTIDKNEPGYTKKELEIGDIYWVESGSSQESTDSIIPTEKRGQALTYWIRPFDGWTRRLANHCITQQNGEQSRWRRLCTSTILLEGPYHNRHGDLIKHNDRLLMIAGGTGIAAIAPWVQTYMDRVQASVGHTVGAKSVRVVWTNRGSAFIDDVMSKELATARMREDVSFDLYNTAARQVIVLAQTSDMVSDLTATSKSKEISIPESGRSSFESGVIHARPDIAKIISDEAECFEGRITVLLCGPASMADEARAAILAARKNGVDMHYAEEVFGW